MLAKRWAARSISASLSRCRPRRARPPAVRPLAVPRRRPSTSTTQIARRPRWPASCDIDGAQLIPARRRQARDHPGTPRAAAAADVRGRRLLQPTGRAAHGRRRPAPSTKSPTRCCAPSRSRRADAMFGDRRVTLKSAAQIEKMAVAGRLVADVLDRLGERARAGHHDGRSRPHRRGAHPQRAAASRRSSACPAASRRTGTRCASRSTTRSSTACPGRGASARARSCRSTPAPSSTAGTATRRARFIVGEVPPQRRATWSRRREQAMYAGIAAAVPGNYLSDISAAIEDVAREHGYGVVRAFVGHGIGTEMHEEPQVTNYRTGTKGRRIEPGLCLAIEPMFTLGTHDVRIKRRRLDRRHGGRQLAAHWEHTHRDHRGRPAHPDHHSVTLRRQTSAGRVGGEPATWRCRRRCCRSWTLWYTLRSCAGPRSALRALGGLSPTGPPAPSSTTQIQRGS